MNVLSAGGQSSILLLTFEIPIYKYIHQNVPSNLQKSTWNFLFEFHLVAPQLITTASARIWATSGTSDVKFGR